MYSAVPRRGWNNGPAALCNACAYPPSAEVTNELSKAGSWAHDGGREVVPGGRCASSHPAHGGRQPSQALVGSQIVEHMHLAVYHLLGSQAGPGPVPAPQTCTCQIRSDHVRSYQHLSVARTCPAEAPRVEELSIKNVFTSRTLRCDTSSQQPHQWPIIHSSLCSVQVPQW